MKRERLSSDDNKNNNHKNNHNHNNNHNNHKINNNNNTNNNHNHNSAGNKRIKFSEQPSPLHSSISLNTTKTTTTTLLQSQKNNNNQQLNQLQQQYFNNQMDYQMNFDNNNPIVYHHPKKSTIREIRDLPISIILHILQFYEFSLESWLNKHNSFINNLNNASDDYDDDDGMNLGTVQQQQQQSGGGSGGGCRTLSLDFSSPNQFFWNIWQQHRQRKQIEIMNNNNNNTTSSSSSGDTPFNASVSSSSSSVMSLTHRQPSDLESLFLKSGNIPIYDIDSEMMVKSFNNYNMNNMNNDNNRNLHFDPIDDTNFPHRVAELVGYSYDFNSIYNENTINTNNTNNNNDHHMNNNPHNHNNRDSIMIDLLEKHVPTNANHCTTLLTRALYGRFTRDFTRTVYCIFPSIKIQSDKNNDQQQESFPLSVPLIKMMHVRERINALKYVMGAQRIIEWINRRRRSRRRFQQQQQEWSQQRTNVMNDIQLTLKLLNRKHVRITVQSLLRMSHKLVHVNASNLELNDQDFCLMNDSSDNRSMNHNSNSNNRSENENNRMKKYSLTSMDLSRNKISDQGIIQLCHHTRGTSFLRRIDLSRNDIGDAGASTALFSHPHIQSLNLSHNNITDHSVERLENNRVLQNLDLSFNMINERGIQSITQCTSLRKLCLRYMCLKDSCMSSFYHLPHLQELDLSHNSITDEGAVTLSNLSNSLVTLHLGFNHLTGIGAGALFKSTHLQVLSLNNNRIYSDALKTLLFNNSLTHLDLSNNMIDDIGAMVITRSRSLKSVNLANNNITVDGARHFLLCPHMKFNLRSQQTSEPQQQQQLQQNPSTVSSSPNRFAPSSSSANDEIF